MLSQNKLVFTLKFIIFHTYYAIIFVRTYVGIVRDICDVNWPIL